MNFVQKRRLLFVVILCLFSTLAAFLIIRALKQNVNFFFTPSQIVRKEADKRVRLRVGGVVQKGSVVRGPGLQVAFIVTDFAHELKIHYTGLLPDLFKEGQGIVALGSLNSHQEFVAEEVLAKHDENYLPPQINHQPETELKTDIKTELKKIEVKPNSRLKSRLTQNDS